MRSASHRTIERPRRKVVLALVVAVTVGVGAALCAPRLGGEHPQAGQTQSLQTPRSTATVSPMASASTTTTSTPRVSLTMLPPRAASGGTTAAGAAELAPTTVATDPGTLASVVAVSSPASAAAPTGSASGSAPSVTAGARDTGQAAPTPAPGTVAATPGPWISVDAAAQAAATAAFFARTPAAVPASGAVMVPQFSASCSVSHRNNDDPVVFPGRSGVSHAHTYIGNRTTSASSTLASLLAGSTTCNPGQDRSAYWIPTLYDGDDETVDPDDVTILYGSDVRDTSVVQPFPQGLRMVAGDEENQDPLPTGNFWCSGPDADEGRTADGFPICGENSSLLRQIGFPQCWDGVHLDSPDHTSHMSQPVNGACPADHPVAVPALSYVLRYPKSLGHNPSGITLSSGSTYSMHAGFYNAWQVDALAQRVRNCIDQHVRCGANGKA